MTGPPFAFLFDCPQRLVEDFGVGCKRRVFINTTEYKGRNKQLDGSKIVEDDGD